MCCVEKPSFLDLFNPFEDYRILDSTKLEGCRHFKVRCKVKKEIVDLYSKNTSCKKENLLF